DVMKRGAPVSRRPPELRPRELQTPDDLRAFAPERDTFATCLETAFDCAVSFDFESELDDSFLTPQLGTHPRLPDIATRTLYHLHVTPRTDGSNRWRPAWNPA